MSAAPAPTYQALYRACMKEAAGQAPTLMGRLVARASDAMLRRGAAGSDETERRALIDAARTLVKHEASLCEAYPQALLGEFAQAIAGGARKAGAVSFDALELMGEDQIRENVELMRMQQAVDAQVDSQLASLNALISSVQGLNSVEPDRNPLRPQVYVRALRTVTLQSPIPSAMRARWMLHLGEALGPELARLYAELAGWMRSQGVQEVRFGAPPAAEPAPEESPLLNLRELRKLLTGHFGDSAGGDSVRPDFSKTMPAAFDALENMKQAQVDLVAKRLKARQETEEEGGDVSQVLAQEVVRLMLDTIAHDPRLLAPVQQCVRDLEPALMRLARDDPRFFSDRKHPARRLLEELTQRSLAWESADAPGFAAFIDPLQQAVEVLRGTRVRGPEPFDFALKTLEETWGDVQRRERRQREKAVRALLNAEQRNLLADKISKGLRTRPDLAAAPDEITAFVTGPWSQVIAQARLSDTAGSHDPGGYTSILTDLVWSAQPHVAGTQKSRLLALVPTLVEKIRQGLSTIDYPKDATERFLDYLSRVHRLALRSARPAAERGDVPQTQPPNLTREELEAMMGAGDDAPGAWLAPGEAQDSGFMQSHASVPSTLTDTIPDMSVDGFHPGTWVEMLTAQGWERFQVTWASPHGTLFMFTGRAGRPQSMTRRLLSKMLDGGALRLVAGQDVVEGALDAVAEKALRNTAHSKL